MVNSKRISEIARRIQSRLNLLGKTARGASVEAGLSPFAINNIMKNPESIPRGTTVMKLAPVLETTSQWILEGDAIEQYDGDSDDKGRIRSPLYGGIVEAGAFRLQNEFDQDATLRTVDIPPSPHYPVAKQFASEVQGDSMLDAGIASGMWVLAVERHAWERVHGNLRDGKLVVAMRMRAGTSEIERTVKRLRITQDRIELLSENKAKKYNPIVLYDKKQPDETYTVDIVGVVISATLML